MPHPKDEACRVSPLFDQDKLGDKELLAGCRLLETDVVTFCNLALHSFKYNTCDCWRLLFLFWQLGGNLILITRLISIASDKRKE